MQGLSELFCLYAARAARGFGDGFAAIILTAYLIELGFTPFQVGAVATAALLGSATLTLVIGLLGNRYNVRGILLVCAGLMVATGLAFPNVEHYFWIVAIAFVGTINPTTGDIGVHGRDCSAPNDAIIHFQGDDPVAGHVIRYTTANRLFRRNAA